MLSSQFDPDPKARPMFDTVSHQPCKRARASIFLPTGPWLGPSRAVGYAFYSFYRAMMRRSVLFMCFMRGVLCVPCVLCVLRVGGLFSMFCFP